MQFSSEKPLDPLTLDIHPGPQASTFTLFEDDGVYGYEQGQYCTTKYDSAEADGRVTVTIHARDAHGGFAHPTRGYFLKIHGRVARKYSVELNRKTLAGGWNYAANENLVTVAIPDDGRENVVVIRPAAGMPERSQH